MTGKIGGVAVDAGRMDVKLHTGTVVDATFDAAKVAYGKDIKLTAVAAKTPDGKGKWDRTQMEAGDRMYVVDLSAKLGKINGYVTYYKADIAEDDNQIWVVGADTKLAKDLTLKAEWLNGQAKDDYDKNGYMVGLAYKGASAAKVGSYGLYANYYDQPIATMLEQTVDGYAQLPAGYNGTGDGFKGFEVGANYAIAKNIVAAVKYYDLETREGDSDDQTLWGEVVFSF